MKILFVCSANICRSALAEVILKEKLKEIGITSVEVESAGIHDYAGEPRDYTMVAYALKAGYEMGGVAVHLTQEMADSADLIICMENCHIVEIQRRFLPYVQWRRIHLFNEICFGEKTGLPDPTGDIGYMYDCTLRRVEEGCRVLAEKISRMINDSTE